jgi:hypothetical protein
MSTSTVIQAAAAVYGVVPGNAFVTTVNQELATVFAGDENALLNHYYQAIFTWNPATSAYDGEGGVTAEAMAINMGFTGEARTTEAARLAGELESVGIEARGAKTKELIDAFEAGGTELATAFTALKNTVITSVADPSYTGISVTLSELGGFASLKPANITLGTTDAINEVALAAGAATTTGTAGIDIISGVVSSLSSERTLDQADSIDGGEGTNDTLEVVMKGNFSGFTTGTGALKGVEKVSLVNDGIIARSFDATGAEGIASISLNSTKGNLSLTNLPEAGISVSLVGQKSGDLSVGFKSTAVSGTSDSLSVSLQGSIGTTSNVGLQVPLIESLTIVSGGTAANKVSLGSTSTALKAVTVTGSSDLTLSQETAGISLPTAIDASGLAGSFTVSSNAIPLKTLVGAQGVNTITLTGATASLEELTGGAGNDSFSVVTGTLKVNAAINGGDGTDTLTVASGATRSLSPVMSSVESVKVGAITGDLTIEGTDISGLESVEVGSLGANVTLSKLASPDLILNLANATSVTGTSTVSADNTGAATINLSTTSATAITNSLKATVSKATDLSVNVGAKVTYSGVVTANATKAVTVTSEASTATLASGLASGSSVVAAAAELVTVNSGGELALAVTAGEARNVNINHNTVTTSTGSVTLTAAKTEQLTLNTNQPFTLAIAAGSNLNALQILGATSSTEILTLPALGKLTSATISGTGTTSSKESELNIENIGGIASTNSESLQLTISGFKAGIHAAAGATTGPTIGALGGITLNLDGLTSASTSKAYIGAITSVSGDIEVKVAGSTSPSVVLGTVDAKKGAATVSLVSAGEGSTFSAINGKSINFTGFENYSNTVTATLQEKGTAVTINGGTKADTLTVVGDNAASTLTVSGSLGFPDGGTDVLKVSTVGGSATDGTVTINVSGVTGQLSGSWVRIGGDSNAAPFTNSDVDVGASIVGSSLRDYIVAPAVAKGATITGGAGDDVFYIPTSTSTVVKSGAAATINVYTITKPVVITDFNSGVDLVSIQGVSLTNTVHDTTNTTAPAVPTTNGLSTTILGTYSASSSEFTFSNTGSDTLLLADTANGDFGVVLQGYKHTAALGVGGTIANDVALVGASGDAFTGLVGVA